MKTKRKFYFENQDSEICYDKDYFINMIPKGEVEIEVFEAVPEIIGGGIFWCKEQEFCGDDTAGICGKKNCDKYSPRNKISGVCRHHRHWLYKHGSKIKLTK